MSKIDAAGMEHGKRGNKIYQVLNGKQIAKDPYRPTNPRTPAQQRHRAKLACANSLSARLAAAVNLGFAAVAAASNGLTPRNIFVKTNWDNGALRWDDEAAQWLLCPERLLLADGPRHIPDTMTAAVDDGMLVVDCPDVGLADSNAVADDQLVVAAYLPDVAAMALFRGPLRGACRRSAFPLADELRSAPSAMHVYAWFQATCYHRASGAKTRVSPGQASPSRYLGTIQLLPA